MSCFTRDNTEGYSAADLAILNEAHQRVMAARTLADNECDMDPEELSEMDKHVSDALHNAWQDGSTVDDLIGRLTI